MDFGKMVVGILETNKINKHQMKYLAIPKFRDNQKYSKMLFSKAFSNEYHSLKDSYTEINKIERTMQRLSKSMQQQISVMQTAGA